VGLLLYFRHTCMLVLFLPLLFIMIFINWLNNSMYQSLSWESKQVLSQSTNSPHFIKTEGLLPHSQQPAICPNPQPDKSILPSHSTCGKFILILSSHLCVGLPSNLFSSRLPTEILYTPLLYSMRFTCPAHLIILDLITQELLLLLFSVSPLCRVSTLIFLRQTMSLRNTVLQLFWCNYSWCVYR
jgi:hypothetical protein